MKRRIVGFFIGLVVLLGLVGCGNDNKQLALFDTPIIPIIPETTKVLSSAESSAIVSVSTDSNTVVFSQATASIQDIAVGDVIVSDVSNTVPYGILRKVESVSTAGDLISVVTSTATLEDAIDQGILSASGSLDPADLSTAVLAKGASSAGSNAVQATSPGSISITMSNVVLYDNDHNLATTHDQVVANGNVSLRPSFDLDLLIMDKQLKKLKFTNTTTQTASISVSVNASASLVSESVTIAKYTFKPLTFLIGTFPVVVVPELTVKVKLDGKLSIGITSSMTEVLTVTGGLSYQSGVWTPIASHSTSFTYAPPTASATSSVKVSAGPSIAFKLYNIAGPHADLDAYLKYDVDSLAPSWSLRGGLTLAIGAKIELFSKLVASYQATVVDYSKVLASSGGGAATNPLIGTWFHSATASSSNQTLTLTDTTWQNNDQGNGGCIESGTYTYTNSAIIFTYGPAGGCLGDPPSSTFSVNYTLVSTSLKFYDQGNGSLIVDYVKQ